MDECNMRSGSRSPDRRGPDILVGLAIALMFGASAIGVLRDAIRTALPNRVLGVR